MNIYHTRQQERLERVAHEAAEWLQVMQGSPGADERTAFTAWVQASPEHLRELLVAGMLERELAAPGMLDGFDVDTIVACAQVEANVVALNAASPVWPPQARSALHPRRAAAWWVALAASWAGLMVGGAWLGLRPTEHVTLYATTLGEQRAITLADGSVVKLAPSTRIDVSLSSAAREIHLRAGEANFKVAHDSARPFRVHAGASVLQAVGTEFSVNRLPSGTVVAVTEGVVKLSVDRMATLDDGLGAWLESWAPAPADAISRPGVKMVALDAPRNLVAGASAHIARDARKAALGEMDRNVVGDAVAIRLLFRDDTLADIAAEFNRFNAMQIVVEGDAARLQRYSGVFDARDSASFLEFLRCCSSLSVAREGEKTLVRQPATQIANRR